MLFAQTFQKPLIKQTRYTLIIFKLLKVDIYGSLLLISDFFLDKYQVNRTQIVKYLNFYSDQFNVQFSVLIFIYLFIIY